MNTYELMHVARCPNGGLVDTYAITIRSHQTILVEDIQSALKSLPVKAFQEDLATQLRNTLGAPLKVVGWHHGIKITSERE